MEVSLLTIFLIEFNYWFFKIKLRIRSYIRNKTGDFSRFKHNLEKTQNIAFRKGLET